MTIGIAARGTNAGRAVLRGLLAAELLGRGEIAGFCTFAWRDKSGAFRYATTQRGGTADLGPVPREACEAGWAALISSGPDRAEPLTQFLATSGEAGLVTGHRLPTSRTATGAVLNEVALALMAQGKLSQATLDALLAAPGMDAGLICLPLKGPCVMANASRVEGRDDQGRALIDEGERVVAVLHNSITTVRHHGNALAETVAEIASDAMGGQGAAHGIASLPDQIRVTAAAEDAIHLDAEGRVAAIHSCDPAYEGIRPGITAIYTRTPVWQQGRLIGHAASEVFARVDTRVLHARATDVARSFVFTRL